MQIRNDFNLIWEIRGRYGIPTEKGEGVFNGDIGIITEINSFAQSLTVQLRRPLRRVRLQGLREPRARLRDHDPQVPGLRYPAVIVPMYGPSMLMNRNLLYTAVTRARSPASASSATRRSSTRCPATRRGEALFLPQ